MEPVFLALIEAAQGGDREASERLVRENSGLIWSIVRRFFGRGVEPDDLYQLGCLGFLKAVQGFDSAFGTRFSTYAVPKIAGEIRRFLRDDGAVKVSRGVKERAQLIRIKRSELTQTLGREPSLSELAVATGLTAEEIATAEIATEPAESLQQESFEDGFTLSQVLGTSGQEEALLERLALSNAIARLPEKEQKIVALRYFHTLTQQKTARILGISQVQVSRLERRAIEELKDILTAAEA